ncbi:MAG: hypothetical protein SNJ57_19435 [Cyanobacteriota bacterium]
MIYTFWAETESEAKKVVAIALDAAKTIDQWHDNGAWWIKIWTTDRDLPKKVRPHACLERREW